MTAIIHERKLNVHMVLAPIRDVDAMFSMWEKSSQMT